MAQAFVYGDSLQAALVAIIVPDEEILKKWAKENGLSEKSFQELCKTEKVKVHLLNCLKSHGKAHDLKGFEAVKAIYVDNELFSVENNILVRFLSLTSCFISPRRQPSKSSASKPSKSIKNKSTHCTLKLDLLLEQINCIKRGFLAKDGGD